MGAPALQLPSVEPDTLIEGDPTTEAEIAEMDAFWAIMDPEGHAALLGGTGKGKRPDTRRSREPLRVGLRKRNGCWSESLSDPLVETTFHVVPSYWLRKPKRP